MKRPALQNKHVVVYEWLFRPEKFSGLSRNGPLDWHMTWERILFRPAKSQPSRKLGNDAICFNGPFNLVPRVLSFPFPGARENGKERIWERGCGPFAVVRSRDTKWISRVSVFSHCCTTDLPVFMVRCPRRVPFYSCFCSNGIMCSSDVISLYTMYTAWWNNTNLPWQVIFASWSSYVQFWRHNYSLLPKRVAEVIFDGK